LNFAEKTYIHDIVMYCDVIDYLCINQCFAEWWIMHKFKCEISCSL